MATCLQTVDLEPLARVDELEALSYEVRRGLSARPRSLSPWMFYDAEGSSLFERITSLPEYYPTRTERAILAEHADAILAGLIATDRCHYAWLSWVPALPRKPAFCSKLHCAIQTTLCMYQWMYAPTPSTSRATTLQVRCPTCAFSPLSGTMSLTRSNSNPSMAPHSRSISAQASATFRRTKHDSSCEIYVLSCKPETRSCSVRTW